MGGLEFNPEGSPSASRNLEVQVLKDDSVIERQFPLEKDCVLGEEQFQAFSSRRNFRRKGPERHKVDFIVPAVDGFNGYGTDGCIDWTSVLCVPAVPGVDITTQNHDLGLRAIRSQIDSEGGRDHGNGIASGLVEGWGDGFAGRHPSGCDTYDDDLERVAFAAVRRDIKAKHGCAALTSRDDDGIVAGKMKLGEVPGVWAWEFACGWIIIHQ